MMNKIILVTNILVYSYGDNDIEKKAIAKRIISMQVYEHNLFISSQIFNEFYNVLTRKMLEYNEINKYMYEIYNNFYILPISAETTLKALELRQKYHFAWYDTLILAAAIENQCSILYSEDYQHNQIIEETLTIINPFLI